MNLLIYLLIFYSTINLNHKINAYEVIYAINAGSDEPHLDEHGIFYDRDPLADKIGIKSDYGKQIVNIGRIPIQDTILYQTERYHTSTFGYDIPVVADGDYLLILKFCEVYFTAPNMKVFDVVLNGDHTIVTDLDIYGKVGKGVAHDEYIKFSISRGRLHYKEEDSEIRGGRVRIEFIKGYRDNPKINAIALIKSVGDDIDRIPKLPTFEFDDDVEMHHLHQHQQQQQEQQQQQQQHNKQHQRNNRHERDESQYDSDNVDLDEDLNSLPVMGKERKTSGPRQEDPYSLDDSSMMLPVFIAIGAFIPLLFCLCKL